MRMQAKQAASCKFHTEVSKQGKQAMLAQLMTTPKTSHVGVFAEGKLVLKASPQGKQRPNEG